MKIKTIFFLLLLFPGIFSIQGQKFYKEKIKTKIPFQFENNTIIIPVFINGHVVHLILDTGAKHTAIINPEVFNQIQPVDTTPVKIKGLGQKKEIDGLLSKNETLRLGAFELHQRNIIWIKDTLIDFSDYYYTPIDGLIGSDVLAQYILEINFQTKKIILHSPHTYRSRRDKNKIPIRLIDKKPAIRFSIANKKGIFLIDTGNTDAVWLYGKLPESHPYKLIYGYLGLGVSGEIYGYSTIVEHIFLARKKFKKIPIAMPDSVSLTHIDRNILDGLLGNTLLKKFKIIINYPEKYVVLKKYFTSGKYIPYDKSGLVVKLTKPVMMEVEHIVFQFEKSERNSSLPVIRRKKVKKNENVRLIQVKEVIPGSPADKAGILSGDLIEEINGKPVYEMKTLSEFTGFLSKHEGYRIHLKIKRNNIDMEINFRLADYYKK